MRPFRQNIVTMAIVMAIVTALNGGKYSVRCEPSPADSVHNVASNTALKALPATAGTATRRLGFAATGDAPSIDYVYSSSPCSMNSGLGDNGFQVQGLGGGCWVGNFAGVVVTPMIWGCVGDGSADDTRCLQAAINGAAAAGVKLNFDAGHLYRITNTVTIANPLDVEGPYRYGIWSVNQASGTGPQKCPWGIVAGKINADLIRASAVTGTIRGLCIDAVGSANTEDNPPGGAAINLTPPDASHFASGWHIEQSTILQPYDGIALYGNGVVNQCCGIGGAADGIVIAQNTIISPSRDGISVGRNSMATAGGPNQPGVTVTDNAIVCKNTASKATGTGVRLIEGAIWYSGTQNGPEGCHIGTAVTPGVLSGQAQFAQLSGDGVFGDQSGLHDLLIQPAGGQVGALSIGGIQPWANATGNVNTILIDCTQAAYCSHFRITGLFVGIGAGANQPAVDIEGGTNGPYDVLFEGNTIVQMGQSADGAISLKLNAGSGSTGRWVINGNQIGAAFLGGGQSPVGIALTINARSTSQGSVTITNNDISTPATPIKYTPNVTDKVIIENNMGVNTVTGSLRAASTVTLSNATADYEIGGKTAISHILGAWQGRKVRFHSDGSGINLRDRAGGTGPICANSNSAAQEVWLEWVSGGSCWTHIP